MKTITTNNIITINAIHAEANKPAELLDNKQAEQDKHIL